MPLVETVVYHITMTATLTVVDPDAASALTKAKTAIAAGQADFSWTQTKEKVVTLAPAP